jgi:hypothetical protein
MSKLCKLVIKSNGLRSTIRFLAALITRSFFKGDLISEALFQIWSCHQNNVPNHCPQLFNQVMCDSSHIRSVLIGVEY